VDPSPGMIVEAEKGEAGANLTFAVQQAEELDFREAFDVIFCNSAFQWFKDERRALEKCRRRSVPVAGSASRRRQRKYIPPLL